MNFSEKYCVFRNRMDDGGRIDQFYRKANDTSPEWYLGLNKDGTVRCGNVTKRDDPGAIFSRIDINGREFVDSPVFKNKRNKLKCCKRKRCKNRKPKRCRSKNKCRTLRRKFFELSLKQLKKYYKNCVEEADAKRHCKKKQSKKS